MWATLLSMTIFFLLVYLTLTTVYLLVLTAAYFLVKEPETGDGEPFIRFAVLVPAHNEELLVGTVCKSLLQVDYPNERYQIFLVADNCQDATASIGRQQGVTVLERDDPEHGGKGQALDWALRQIGLDEFDAVLIVDADNYVDPGVLRTLNGLLNQGEQAIQCYNAVGNRDDSGFTQLLYVSRVIGNQLYHQAKQKLGLSSYLMGNGICFRTDLLQRKGWTAFSEGEDWEYYAQLVEDGVKVGFAAQAKVFHQESRSLNQATTQRLRWSHGRFAVAKSLGWRLLWKGLRERKWWIVDASFPLLLPNYSLLVNLTVAGLLLSLVLPVSASLKVFLILSFSGVLGGLFVLFLAGCWIAGSPGKLLRAALYAPVFLAWKSVIDLLSITGLYRNKGWVRTRRH